MRSSDSAIYRRLAQKPLSPRRPAAYERAASGGALPEKFFDSRIRLAAVCPETALMYAVLEDAFLCLHQQFTAEPSSILRAREAEEWFFDDHSRRLFSFLSICDALALEPRFIRKKLRDWNLSGLDIAPAAR